MSLGRSLNSFFDQVYVITLERSLERQDKISENLYKHGVKFSFIEGVDGSSLNIDDLEQKNIYKRESDFKYGGEFMTLGEIGCSLSTLKICRKIVEDKLQSVLILQDDAKVVEENLVHSKDMLASIDTSWDVLYLSHSKTCLSMSLKTKLKLTLDLVRFKLNPNKYSDPEIAWLSYRRPYNKYWFKSGSHFGTWSYGISLEGAKKLINAFTPVVAIDDAMITHLILNQELKAFSPKYFLFDHNVEMTSEIGDRPSWRVEWPK
jgi:GR25 family glycosyltransferase involved in LPS biosynthesis